MKRLFFQLLLSVMISACHNSYQQQKNDVITNIKPQDEVHNDCLNNSATQNLHKIDNIAVQGCPVR